MSTSAGDSHRGRPVHGRPEQAAARDVLPHRAAGYAAGAEVPQWHQGPYEDRRRGATTVLSIDH